MKKKTSYKTLKEILKRYMNFKWKSKPFYKRGILTLSYTFSMWDSS